MTTAVRHKTRALLRAHLAAATGYRHLTRHCPICHQLLRLALEPHAARSGAPAPRAAPEPPPARCEPPAAEDESPATR
ncbi:DUF6274 family protein [Streptomyces sp. NBC_01456]|uniref:DUF6274 family protein n=1 Tax=unclassified Streptomyces TaxID=2593676 RepID=UPI002E33A7B1|nr:MULTISPECIES: DUF6274 family protein [unclassified Streptomyces]